MTGWALVLFVVVGYGIPVQGKPLFEHLFAMTGHGANSLSMLSYYLAMVGMWMVITTMARAGEHVAYRDDRRWRGFLLGFDRHGFLSGFDLVIGGVAFWAWRAHVEHQVPTHGLWPLIIAIVCAFVAGPMLAAVGQKSQAVAGLAVESNVSLPKGFPGPADFDGLVEIARNATGPDVSSTTKFHYTSFRPPGPPDCRIGNEATIQVHYQIYHGDVYRELSRPMVGLEPELVAQRIAEASMHPAILQLAYLLAGERDQERTFRIKKVVQFVEENTELVEDAAKRSPLVVLYERKASGDERSWLVAALLRAAGIESGIWYVGESENPKYGPAVAHLTSSQYLSGLDRPDPESETNWLLLEKDGVLADESAKLFALPDPAELRGSATSTG